MKKITPSSSLARSEQYFFQAHTNVKGEIIRLFFTALTWFPLLISMHVVPVVHRGILSCLTRPPMGTTSEGSKAIQVRYIVLNNLGPEIATHPVKLQGN